MAEELCSPGAGQPAWAAPGLGREAPGLRGAGAGGHAARMGPWSLKALSEGNSEEAAGNAPLHHPWLRQRLLGFIPLTVLIMTSFQQPS